MFDVKKMFERQAPVWKRKWRTKFESLPLRT